LHRSTNINLFFKVTEQNILGVESNTELKQESESLTARIIDIIDNMEE
jgi:hypothetical protein